MTSERRRSPWHGGWSAKRILAALLCLLAWVAGPAAAQSGAWETIRISGRDYVSVDSIRAFYGFPQVSRTGDMLVLENAAVVLKLRLGTQECRMNNVKFVFSYAIESQGSKAWVSQIDLVKLVDPVLRPSFITRAGSFRTVVLDPGHGGKDPGTETLQGNEASFALQVAFRLRQLLVARGFQVVMTRSNDTYLTLQERVDIANRIPDNALFLSIHFNCGEPAARGIETFTLSPQGVAHYGRGLMAKDFEIHSGNEHDSANIALATAVHGSVLRQLGGAAAVDRGIKRARYSVLSGVRHPAVLFEGGFMTHPEEGRLIAGPAYQSQLAQGMADAVVKYRLAVTARSAGSR